MSLTLYIIRHAKTSHEQFFPGDFYRTLDPKGYKEAQVMAGFLSGKNDLPQLFISSTAIRAYSTALLFAKQLNYLPENILLKDAIYDAPLNRLYKVLQETNDDHHSVALFGHNPGFTDLLNDLCGFTIDNLPTSGIACISFKNKNWSSLNSGDGKLIYIKFP